MCFVLLQTLTKKKKEIEKKGKKIRPYLKPTTARD